MKAKEYLNQAYKIEMQIKSKLDQIEALRSLAEKATPTLSNTPRGTSHGNQLESTLVRIVDMENEINSSIDKLLDIKAEIGSVIAKVDNPDLRLVLELRYLCYKPWPQIAEDMHYDLRQIHRLHSQALFAVESKRCH